MSEVENKIIERENVTVENVTKIISKPKKVRSKSDRSKADY